MQKLIKQILRFGVVGFICFFIEYAIMVALVELVGTSELVASATGFTVSVIVNYILSVTVVFEADKEANKVRQFIVFVVLSLIGLGINQLIMWIGIDWLSQYMNRAYLIVKLFATGVVMVYNFITRKIFIEKHEK
ncbi:MAG: GtrA family protein [Lachnospiraceae bacterium]|nr:GtrA family protein [Lachnospiraceae bacterium]